MTLFEDLPEIWKGGFLFYNESQLSAIKTALVNFQQQNDTKGVVVGFLIYSSGQVCSVMVTSPLTLTDTVNSSQLPSSTPSGIFDEFLAIPSTGGNVSTQSYSSMVLSVLPLVDYHGLRLVMQPDVWWSKS